MKVRAILSFRGTLLIGSQDKFSVAIAALTLAFCRGCGSDINADDILMTILRQLTPGMPTLLDGIITTG